MPTFDPSVFDRAPIQIPSNPAPAVAFAAEELQRYLQALTGGHGAVVQRSSAALPYQLILGDNGEPAGDAIVPPAGGFVVVPQASRVVLAASSARALLSAAYALLEQLGCRWSLDGTHSESIPRLSRPVQVPVIEHTPRFAVRGYCSDIMTWHYTQPEHFAARAADDRAFIDWMGKSGANVFFYIRHPFDTQLTIPELLPEFQRRGIEVEYGGHVIPLLLPRELYRDHPEYFPQPPAGGRTDFGNLCTSNTAALTTAAGHAVRYVHAYPEMSAIHIWGADLWHGGWCNCSACGGLTVQDQSVRVCNAVARGLATAGVHRPIYYLAYHDTIDPDLHVSPDDSVWIEFAPRERCYAHALNDPHCATNRRYAAALERYVELFAGRVRLFEYYGDAILFFGCAVPLAEVIGADLAYYRHLGVPGITMLQFGRFSLWAYPVNFLAFAAGVTTECGTRALRAGYCARFGAHGALMEDGLQQLESTMRHVVTYGDIRRPPHGPPAAQVLQQIERALPQIQQLAARLERPPDAEIAAHSALLHHTATVLDGVRCELRNAAAGDPAPPATDRYAAALQILDAVDARWKGLWGTVDLPIVHSFYTAAAALEP